MAEATELQLRLFKENPECIELATIMASIIYPKIVNLLIRLGIEEVHFERIEGLKDCCFTINYEILWFKLDANKERMDTFTIDCKGKTICPYFCGMSGVNLNITQSPSEKYLRFCESVMNSLPTLEQKVLDINKTLEKARNISLPLKRNVIFEKINIQNICFNQNK